ncbi:uncharacterized protein MKK02DRAFT_41880 [Dioszegia hungarica]|uniref:Uncharacterized protein n=1 Tax=Dioszegia hungarica TaxID=4972 RepID=A0AA38HFY8_9TREE|nr:uncharacterized protein MKK02DRAFT_41880 [Dioszegia hungarica]KAI9638854.1 hypothetical protein MKK02DRAFT_41880 [Dioszegia hungarica]
MATSTYPSMASQNPLTQLIAHSALKVAQAGATVLPPAYLVSSLILRRGTGFSVRGLMRSANMAVLGGGALGAGAAWVRLRGASAESLEDRVFRLSHSTSQVHVDDYSFIGSALSAVVIPAIFLKRAPLPSLVTGGASVGLGVGSWTHIAGMFSQGKDVRPEGMVGELPVVGGNNKP